MPEKQTVDKAMKAKRQGKAPSTQAGEFVREEIHHIRQGKHGARSTKQAIAIGLSKARRAGVNLRAPKKGRVSEKTRKSAEQAYQAGREGKATSQFGWACPSAINAKRRPLLIEQRFVFRFSGKHPVGA